MLIQCPQNMHAVHRRKPVKEIPAYCGTASGKILRWEDAEEIYFAAQKMFDRLDVEREIEDQMEEGCVSEEVGRKLLRDVSAIADTYRDWLDDDAHTDTVLCEVLWRAKQKLM